VPNWGANISIRLPMEATSRMPNLEEEEELIGGNWFASMREVVLFPELGSVLCPWVIGCWHSSPISDNS
jgi:hypothetical protein